MSRILWALSVLAAALTAATLADLWHHTASASTSATSTATAWTTAATAATAGTTAAWTARAATTTAASGRSRAARRPAARWTVDAVARRAAQRLQRLAYALARERGQSGALHGARWNTAPVAEEVSVDPVPAAFSGIASVDPAPAAFSALASVDPVPAPFSALSALARVEIHVFAWRRTHALRRLWASLLAAERPVLRAIDVVVHIDGDALPEVVALVRSWKWPWGALTVHAEHERRGLAEMVMGAWPDTLGAGGASAAAWFLEDDVEVSPLAFVWLEWCLEYAAAATEDERTRLLGCAFYTPRVDELTPTPGSAAPLPWTPEDVLGTPPALPVFRMQVPCSWGTLWLREPWTRFQAYYDARVRGGLPPPGSLPSLKSATWWMSWKRYLVEAMAVDSLHLVYPAFPGQASFVTNHYEVGVHHYLATDAKQPIPDALRDAPDLRFCVPLLTDADQLARLLPSVRCLLHQHPDTCLGPRPQDRLPLIDWRHQRVN